MNRLKSIFLPVFVAYSVIVMSVSALAVTGGGNLTIWVSVFAASAQVAVYFAWLYLTKVPRTSPGLMGFTVGIFAVTIYGVFASYDQQSPSAGPLLAFLVMVGWMGYVTWYSDLGDRSADRIVEGKKLPTIQLETMEGVKIGSDDWAGQKRLVIFYRGNWCPICTAQIGELTGFRTRFEELGVRITLISPQPQAKSHELAQREGMDFDFLSDPDNVAAKKLGILHEWGLPAGFEMFGYDRDVPKPTTFAIDGKGKVVYADLTTNYRVRPLPQEILKALSGLDA
ncbi:MAG: peroxiredoxin family protein [Flavobacteriales bacterium]|nr:peroxiredoxin family protein [Flavobacteriales bacterium]